MLNFSPDHLDRHPSVEAYAAAKARIFENQTADDWSVVNADDPLVLELARRGRGAPPAVRARRRARGRHGDLRRLDRQPARRPHRAPGSAGRDSPHRPAPRRRRDGGRHGRHACRRRAGGDDRGGRCVSAASSTRWSSSPNIDGVRFVNDSKATNVESALRSIESFDVGSGADYRRAIQGWRSAAASRPARQLVPGLSSRSARHGRWSATPWMTSWTCMTPTAWKRRYGWAFDLASPAGVVLLAPACASFDMFRDYAERGRRFKEEVARLVRERRA